jgi:hypothetical protein
MDCVGRDPMDAAFGVGHALKDGDGFGLDPIGEGAGFDQVTDVGKGALAVVGMGGSTVRGRLVVVRVGSVVAVTVVVVVTMIVTIGVVVRMGMAGAIGVSVFVGVGKGIRIRIRIKSGKGRGGEVDVELGAADQGFLAASAVEVITR